MKNAYEKPSIIRITRKELLQAKMACGSCAHTNPCGHLTPCNPLNTGWVCDTRTR